MEDWFGENVGNSNRQKAVVMVGMARRPDNISSDLEAVRTGIAIGLRTLHSDVLHEAIPERMSELLRLLGQQPEDGYNEL